MKRAFLPILVIFSLSVCAQPSPPIAIIPQPVSVKAGSGQLVLPQMVIISAPDAARIQSTINLLKDQLVQTAGKGVAITKATSEGTLWLSLNKTKNPVLGKEGYSLTVNDKGIFIQANEPAGLYYGAQSLLQLLPAAIESRQRVENITWSLPYVEITDYPRFGWRGLMFDVARHFYTKEEVKGFIDNMVKYKYNLLHLHLTDDEGWRIQINGYPRLTEVGAWNVKKEGYFGTFSAPGANEPRNYGGFYTQDDIREIVQYAAERYVNVMPEIEAPGHALAAVVSYPELSCTPEAKNYVVRSGEQIMDWSHGAPPIALVDNTMCPANEFVYVFLDSVFSQLARLFPFEYIHVGGDETPRNYWQKMDALKALMKKQGLNNMEQVQGYFEKRVAKILKSKGKKFIGWDEVIEGGLDPSAAMMVWRDPKYGTQAAKEGHEVVMCPTAFAYLDYMQGDPITEPRVYASLRLNKTYEFDPMPPGADPKYIKGGQANIWTEQMYNMRTVQYMIWPRAFAIAESVWSQKERKNWDDFISRVEQHFARFDAAEIKYSRAMYDPIFSVNQSKDSILSITLSTEVKGLDVYYSFDNSFPDRFYPRYTDPLTPPKDAVMLKVITYKGKEPVGRMITMPLEELKKRKN